MNILAHVIGTFFLLIAPAPCDPCNPPYEVRQVVPHQARRGAARLGRDTAGRRAGNEGNEEKAKPQGEPGAETTTEDRGAARRSQACGAQNTSSTSTTRLSVRMCHCLLRDRAELGDWVPHFEASAKRTTWIH